ncbi:glycosyl hydrolase [Spirosoma rigui]|uniref:glycosyl hydrolase n=1 Tax=Spirosoma rigui TaxID=564064 RepID=UPI0009B02317|nr:glycosyl hydrolase [Spirosoma rigui]
MYVSRFIHCLIVVGYLLSATVLAQPSSRPVPRPSKTLNTAKPWTFWWWMGSAVTEVELTRQLEQLAHAGLGGVHIIPIYGVKGYENQSIPFLSKRWLAVFAHTVREANRLGLGVDVTNGTGWPFGGPTVTPDMAAHKWQLVDGQLTMALTKQQVKRSSPGSGGPTLDYFDGKATEQYLRWFDSTLVTLPERPRAVYNDSYELYGANWTRDFSVEFRKRRGYALESQLRAFLDSSQTETSIRVRQDYHETLADLLADGFTRTWTGWATKQGYATRNQAHGSPGNLLDLYALADIPETESFGSSRFAIPGLRVDEGYEVDNFGTPNPLAMKFASSAANLMGKRLVSSETGTWLANHFNVSLAQLKPQMDELFTAGINHIFYHGTTYSPTTESWPGWLFYASTNYGPTSHFWNELPALNHYIERCQTRLQASKPDNDVLVYFPIHDLWATKAKSAGGVHQLEVHHVDRWLLQLPFGKLCETLLKRGYSFDYVSDKQLNQVSVKAGQVTAAGGRYRLVLVPACLYMPEATLRRLRDLAKQGATVVFEQGLPRQSAGYTDHDRRDASVRAMGRELKQLKTVRVAADVVQTLQALNIPAEQLAAKGLSFIRKRRNDKPLYFISNLADSFESGWVSLSAGGTRWYRFDPLSDQTSLVPIRKTAAGRTEVWLRLLPGQSCFLTTEAPAPPIAHQPAASQPQVVVNELPGPWTLAFQTGKPAGLPAPTLDRLASWTTLSDSAGYFSGKARYETTFSVLTPPKETDTYRLSLGDVRETARVWVNGQEVGLAWSLPFELTIPATALRQGANILVVEVTNLSANYMRLRDGLQPNWKKFYDINIVDIRYKPFDATKWKPVPSGLLGPVRLIRE